MGKGLSDLQKGLLLMAWENFRAILENRENGSRMKALLDHNKHWVKKDGINLPHLTTHEALQGGTHLGARVSVSRAFKRFEDRGLATRVYQRQWSGYILWTGIELTSKGKEMAKSLMVNTVRTADDINHYNPVEQVNIKDDPVNPSFHAREGQGPEARDPEPADQRKGPPERRDAIFREIIGDLQELSDHLSKPLWGEEKF